MHPNKEEAKTEGRLIWMKKELLSKFKHKEEKLQRVEGRRGNLRGVQRHYPGIQQ